MFYNTIDIFPKNSKTLKILRQGKIFMAKIDRLLTTTISKSTGTKIEKKLINGRWLGTQNLLRKVITYGENTPLKKIGIDKVEITKLPYNYYKDKSSRYDYYSKGIRIISIDKSEEKGTIGSILYNQRITHLIDRNSFGKTLKNYFNFIKDLNS